MASSANTYQTILSELDAQEATLVAVSKTKPNPAILGLYEQGQRDFGENRVQELTDKFESLPKDIRWHFIGHLQTNKVKYLAPFIHLLHAGDSPRVLRELNKQAARNERIIDFLFQFKIAEEDTKYGFDWEQAVAFLEDSSFQELSNIRPVGVMGMATFTENNAQIRQEFTQLRTFFDQLKNRYFAQANYFREISMGMSGDYPIALELGSTMVRIGTLLFGPRS